MSDDETTAFDDLERALSASLSVPPGSTPVQLAKLAALVLQAHARCSVARTVADADNLRRNIGELRLALRDVPPGGASGNAPAWIIRLHRAACEVAGIGVREAEAKFASRVVLHDDEVRAMDAAAEPPETPHPHDAAEQRLLDLFRKHTAEMRAILGIPRPVACRACGKPPKTDCTRCGPDARCSRCSSVLMFSARQRGDGLCGPCHHKATGTQTLADRCRAAGIEPSLVLEILRSPEGRAAIADVIMNPPLRMSDGTWRDVPPGSGPSAREAKRGDVIRHLKRGQVVAVYDNEHNGNLWVNGEGATYTVNPDEWEVVIPAEQAPRRADSLARPRQMSPTVPSKDTP